MDDKNKKISEDKRLDLEDLSAVAGGNMKEDAETNQTTSVSDDTKKKI